MRCIWLVLILLLAAGLAAQAVERSPAALLPADVGLYVEDVIAARQGERELHPRGKRDRLLGLDDGPIGIGDPRGDVRRHRARELAVPDLDRSSGETMGLPGQREELSVGAVSGIGASSAARCLCLG